MESNHADSGEDSGSVQPSVPNAELLMAKLLCTSRGKVSAELGNPKCQGEMIRRNFVQFNLQVYHFLWETFQLAQQF